MHRGDLSAVFTQRIVERKVGNPRRSFFSNNLQTLNHARNDFVFEARVEALCILAHHHQIEIWISTGDIRQRPDRPQVRVEIQSLAQADVDGSEPFADRRRDGAFKADLVAFDGFEQILGQRRAEFIQRLLAGDVLFPFNLYARSFDDAHDGGGDFGADAIAGNQCDTMRHKQNVL